jgi:hypothetical protein
LAEDRARRVSARLTRALLVAEDQRALALALASNGRVELAIRIRSEEGDAGDAALALPWELLAPARPGRYPVREGQLSILREAIAQSTLACRDEAFRRLAALAAPGKLAVSSFREEPNLLFLTAPSRAEVPSAAACPFAPEITAAALHRAGFAPVVGYFGPGDAELDARLKERFHSVLAAGGTVPEAAGAARALLSEPLGEKGARHYFPFGWSQLAVYQRPGPP